MRATLKNPISGPKTKSKTKAASVPERGSRERQMAPRADSRVHPEVTPRANARTARLEVRITPADKKLFAQAAEQRGMNPSELALLLIRRVARQVRDKARIMRYSQKDQEALLASLLNPKKPNRRLVEAAKRYDALFLKNV